MHLRIVCEIAWNNIITERHIRSVEDELRMRPMGASLHEASRGSHNELLMRKHSRGEGSVLALTIADVEFHNADQSRLFAVMANEATRPGRNIPFTTQAERFAVLLEYDIREVLVALSLATTAQADRVTVSLLAAFNRADGQSPADAILAAYFADNQATWYDAQRLDA